MLTAITKVVISFVYIAIIFSICGCVNLKLGGSNMIFCPADLELETRHILGLGDNNSLSAEALFSILEKKDIRYERVPNFTNPHKCTKYIDTKESYKYQAYAGFDETRSHTRNFLIVIDQKGMVLVIENIYSYSIPDMF
jgi:hypothetical protein